MAKNEEKPCSVCIKPISPRHFQNPKPRFHEPDPSLYLRTNNKRFLIFQSDTISARKAFNMLNTVITSKGDLLEDGKPAVAERAWLRLQAGCAMLKICEQKGVGDEYTVEQYYTLSHLAMDPIKQVRTRFIAKLHKV